MTKGKRAIQGHAAVMTASFMVCFFGLMSASWAVNFQYVVQNQKSQTGADGPVLVLEAGDIVKSAKIKISGPTSGKKSLSVGKMNAGARKSIPLKVREGEHTFKVEVSARGIGEDTSTIAFEFDVVRVKPIQVQIDRDNVDTKNGKIAFSVNRPLDRVEMTVKDTDNRAIGTHAQAFGGKSGQLGLSWSPGSKEVGAIEIKAYDTAGFWTSVLLEPWWIEIEHEEIIFDFGKSTWQAAEEPKLTKSLDEIKRAMVKNQRHQANMRLYVSGYTDTVGSAAQNRELSQQRARAISKWFKSNGVNIPVYYQGFGEDAPAVKTPDDTAEPRNRRALYVLGNAPPPQSAAIPRANWSRLR